MVYFLLFLIGLCVGSFINCLVYRLNSVHPRGVSPANIPSPKEKFGRGPLHLGGVLERIGDRSFCDHCKHKLAWHDNIPLLSFILLKGKCRYCHSSISLQYPIVELTTGILFLTSYFWIFSRQEILDIGYWILELFYYWVVISALVAIFVSDLRYGTIPDKIVYPAIGLVVLFHFLHLRGVSPRNFGGPLHLGGVLFSGLGAALFFLALVAITHGKGMGMGDVKLAALMGLILGWPKILVALYLAFLTGAAVGVILVLLGKKHFGEHIPFGPFLTASTFIALFWGEKIWQQISVALL